MDNADSHGAEGCIRSSEDEVYAVYLRDLLEGRRGNADAVTTFRMRQQIEGGTHFHRQKTGTARQAELVALASRCTGLLNAGASETRASREPFAKQQQNACARASSPPVTIVSGTGSYANATGTGSFTNAPAAFKGAVL
jgi:hypothetical protein